MSINVFLACTMFFHVLLLTLSSAHRFARFACMLGLFCNNSFLVALLSVVHAPYLGNVCHARSLFGSVRPTFISLGFTRCFLLFIGFFQSACLLSMSAHKFTPLYCFVSIILCHFSTSTFKNAPALLPSSTVWFDA